MRDGYKTITLVVKEDFKRKIDEVAAEECRSVSGYIKHLLNREMQRIEAINRMLAAPNED